MRMNRRNVVVGLGTVIAGGGIALGSGAFSTAEARRELEVNVVTGTEIAEEYVDIILNDVGNTDSIQVHDGDSTDATSFLPDSTTSKDAYDTYTPDANDVSLMQNDVTIVFGPSGNELPPNSIVGYDGLITVVNEDGGNSGTQEFDVTFEVQDDDEGTLEPNLGFEWDDNTDEPTVSSGSSENLSVDVDTDGEQATGTLVITVTETA